MTIIAKLDPIHPDHLIPWFASEQWLQNFAYHVPVSFKYFVVPAVLAILLTLMTSGYHGIKGIRRDLVSALKHE